MPSASPWKPRNEMDTKEAAISVMGSPLRDSGISQVSMRSRTPANSTIASMKPLSLIHIFQCHASVTYCNASDIQSLRGRLTGLPDGVMVYRSTYLDEKTVLQSLFEQNPSLSLIHI